MQTPPPLEAPAFAPLPLRARSVLETLDIAVKVYKQYFGVLLGWSVVVILCSAVGAVIGVVVPFGGTLPSAMLTPLMTGIVSCCIAAAVRGQRVEFRQCWQFTRPRFWPMVGYYIVALIIAAITLGVIFLVAGLLCAAGIWALSSAPQAVQVITGIVGGVILLTLVTMACTIVMTWHYLVPVVVCMEEDKQNSQALKRAYELLRKQWVQVCTLMTLVGLGMIVLSIILLAAASLLIGLATVQRAFTGQHVETSDWWKIGVTSVLTYLGELVIWKPIFHLILVLFYFDVRVRQEALDLEWAAHVTAPPRETAINPTLTMAPGAFHSFAAPGYPAVGYPAMTAPDDSYAVTTQVPSTTPTAEAAWAPATPVATVVTPPIDIPRSDETGAATAPTVVEAPPPPVTAAPAADSVTCPQCGATAPAGHIFCMRCGTRLRPPQTAPPAGPTQW